MSKCRSRELRLEPDVGIDDCSPHVGYGRIVVAQSFFRLPEVAADDVGELGGVDDVVGVEGV